MNRTTICVLAITAAVLLPDTSVGQSSYRFANINPGVNAPVFDAAGNPLFGTEYVAVLYGGPTTDQLTLAAMPTANRDPMDPVPFQWAPGYFYGGYVIIRTVVCGGYAWLQVRAWDARLGGSYDEVASLGLGGYGESSLFYAYGGADCGNPSPAEPLVGLESFSLRPIPEPSTWALAVVGGLALWWAGRRQRLRAQ